MTSPSHRRTYLARLRPFRVHVGGTIALSIVQAALLLPIPLLLGKAIDGALPDEDTGQMVLIAAVMAGLSVVSVIASICARIIVLRVTMEVARRLRHDVAARLLELPRSHYDTSTATDLHDTVVNDTHRVQIMTSVIVTQLLPSAILSIGISAVLLSLNWQLALVTLGFTPAVFATGRALHGRVQRAADEYHPAFRAFSARAFHLVRNQDLIRLAGAEAHELEHTDHQLEELRQTNRRVAFLASLNGTLQQGIIAVAGAALLLAGGVAVINSPMTLGELLSFYAGFAILRGPAGSLASSFTAIVEGTQAIDLVGHLSMRGVSFGYDETTVLHDISLELEPGHITTLMGPNGSGKSSIVNLFLGFYRPGVGEILADGRPYDDIDMGVFRAQMGVVTQEPLLLPDTVLANIVYGKDYTPAELARALKLSGADIVVDRLPRGLDTHVGDDGVRLSGGQRQRIAIARALIGKPKVLIFDEPTNHLDNEAVAALMSRLREMGDDLAVLMVSHRNEVLEDADESVALDEGKIVWRTQRETPVASGSL
jgi:ATP-binding cassette, subfamily B, bacterial